MSDSSKAMCLRYDEFCDFLGGAQWELAMRHWKASSLSAKRQSELTRLEGRFSSSNQFLFSSHDSSVSPMEILWLKWNLFSDLCREVYLFHKNNQRPHLNIRPSSVRVDFPSGMSPTVPVRWIFLLKLDDTQATRPFSDVSIPPDLGRRIFNAPCLPQKSQAEKLFEVPAIREKSLGYELAGTVLLRSIERIQNTDHEDFQGILTFHFLSEEIHPAEFSENDVFFVTLYSENKTASLVQVWAKKVNVLEKGILLKGTSEAIPQGQWEMLNKAHRQIFRHSRIKIFKSHHVPCDLYSLGMMLFSTLLVNNVCGLSKIEQVIQYIAEGLEPMVQGLEPEDYQVLAGRFDARLKECGPVFSKKSICFSTKESPRSRHFIPDDLWIDLLILAFRLITHVPGFSFCKNHGDISIKQPQQLMERVRSVMEPLSVRIKTELFDAEERNHEIREICRLLRQEISLGEMNQDVL